METRCEGLVILTLTYVSPQAIGEPNIQLTKNYKYPIPLSPMSEDVLEEVVLLGHILTLKYQDYNLLDPEKFPQFQEDQCMCKKID
jgi:hypothetical protein